MNRTGTEMTPLEMAAMASQAIMGSGTLGVVMTLRKGSIPRGFPRGELLNEMQRGGVVERTYSFDPAKIIAWLLKNGLIEMERTGDGMLSFREPK
jgi:hypothetical protein